MKKTKILSKKCLICGDIFYRTNLRKPLHHWNGRKYCSRKCSNQKMPWNTGTKGLVKANKGSFVPGITPWSKGRKFPEFSGELHPNWKPKIVVPCVSCGSLIYLPPWRARYKRYFCNRQCWARGTRGEGSPVFLGADATKPLRVRVMELPEYKQWHASILGRDEYVCVLCGSRKDLEVDHIKKYSSIVTENRIRTPEEARNCSELWNMENGRTLCRECHRKTSTYGTKKSVPN